MNVAIAAQFSGFDGKTQIYLYAAIGTIALLAIAVVVLMGKKGRKGNESLNLDTHFLDGIEGSGGLTKEEMKRVRQAMVRQALRDQGQKPSSSISTKDLSSLAKQGAEVLGAVTKIPEADVSDKPELPPVPEEPVQPKPAESKTPVAENKSGGSIDLDTLLERGLIEPGEYDRLKQLAEESSD